MLKDKVIIVTGGNGLLGQEFIKEIISNNGIAIVADIEKKNVEVNEKKDFFNLDITSKNSINTMIDVISKKYGKIDAIVNNAYPRNKNYGRKFEDVSYDDFCENINLHLGGYFLTCQQIGNFFIKQSYGNIINISSIYGVIAPRFDVYEGTKKEMTMPVEYAAIKSSLIHLTKYLAKYYKHKNIRSNSISPGGIYNNQDEVFVKNYNKYSLSKGMLDKKDISGALIFLLSEKSKFINGQNIVVDDGWSL